jgi:hypothetical protein
MPSGAYIALVNVVDRASGAFQHHAEQVYVAEASPADIPIV